MASLAAMPTYHPWMGDSLKPYLALVLWATVAAAGFLVVNDVFKIWSGTPQAWLLAIAAGAFALIDWAESAQNFTIADRGDSPPRRAFLDSIYWTRALGVVLFVFGIVNVFVHLAMTGSGPAETLLDALRGSVVPVRNWVIISFGAGLGVGLGVVLNHFYSRSPSPPARIVIQAAAIGPMISSAVILLASVIVYEVWRFVGPALDLDLPVSTTVINGEQFAGQLLLLQLALFYFVNALSWAGRPMARAHLGLIVRLQVRTSPGQVKECLDRWCSMLSGRRPHKSAGCRMRAIVRETLYRDIIGFIPVYTLVFTFGLWYGAWQLGWTWLQGLWLIVPFTAATADYIEDICHLRVLKLHERDQPPSLFLTWFAAAMTSIKLVAFAAEAVLTVIIVIAATLRVHDAPAMYGWRGFIAMAISTTATTLVLGLGVWSIFYRLSTRASRSHDAAAPSERSVSLRQPTRDAQ